ncbi:hypothetical protein [Cryobacterium sp. GrIS_2_6]|uniref:hypothetical protein n=1 Tax=Cryobacterium sp. GrIS_2_6 TaxID=3162785 RepID=UPI002E06BC53|nr:hypothetical protein [Cryobacterium psychrotolerans]
MTAATPASTSTEQRKCDYCRRRAHWGARIAHGRTGELSHTADAIAHHAGFDGDGELAIVTGAELAMMTDTTALGHAPLGLTVFNRVARTTTSESVTWVKDSGRADAVR